MYRIVIIQFENTLDKGGGAAGAIEYHPVWRIFMHKMLIWTVTPISFSAGSLLGARWKAKYKL